MFFHSKVPNLFLKSNCESSHWQIETKGFQERIKLTIFLLFFITFLLNFLHSLFPPVYFLRTAIFDKMNKSEILLQSSHCTLIQTSQNTNRSINHSKKMGLEIEYSCNCLVITTLTDDFVCILKTQHNVEFELKRKIQPHLTLLL